MSERPTAEALRAVPLLAGLTDADRAEIAGIAELKSLEAQLPLFREGDPGDALVLLLSGSAQVVKRDPAGKHQVLSVVSAPAVLGEMAVLDTGGKRSASAIAVGPVTLATVPGPALRQRLSAGNVAALRIAHGLAKLLARRLGEVNARLVQVLQSGEGDDGVAEAQRALGHDTAS
ncbi:MAG TPA: cyclic nucleotide-binding domain-containing protein [Myxococcaceae bacterium]|nr:cyclic nucleotide-binding domain-containing protein [Myxococcaceae bacterium]